MDWENGPPKAQDSIIGIGWGSVDDLPPAENVARVAVVRGGEAVLVPNESAPETALPAFLAPNAEPPRAETFEEMLAASGSGS